MLKQALIFASVLSILLVAGIAGYAGYQQRLQLLQAQRLLAEADVAAAQAAAQAAQTASQATELRLALTNSTQQVQALLKEKEQVSRTQQQMEDKMRSALESKDVTISQLQGKLTVNILDRILFASGEAELKPEGEKVLSQVASVLTEHTNRQVYVIGHTDNVPIRASPWSRYPSNWELSTARATSAVRYLSEKAGVNPTQLAAVGYGEYHPAADNSTPEGRARNRRIAIVIMPEQFNPLEGVEPAPSAPVEQLEPLGPPPPAAMEQSLTGTDRATP